MPTLAAHTFCFSVVAARRPRLPAFVPMGDAGDPYATGTNSNTSTLAAFPQLPGEDFSHIPEHFTGSKWKLASLILDCWPSRRTEQILTA